MQKEVTFAMILPSCVRYAHMVEREMIDSKFTIDSAAIVQFTPEQAEKICDRWCNDGSYASRVRMLSSAKVKVYCLSGHNAIKRWRNLIGPEDPGDPKAKWRQLRCKLADAVSYALGDPDNGFYGSVSKSDAEEKLNLLREWKIFPTDPLDPLQILEHDPFSQWIQKLKSEGRSPLQNSKHDHPKSDKNAK